MNPERVVHLQSFIRQIITAVSTSLLYSLDHQQVTRQCIAALESLNALIAGEEEFVLMVVDDELVAGDRPVAAGMYANRFVNALKSKGVGHLRLLKGIGADELRSLVAILARNGGNEEELRSLDNIRFGRVEVRQADTADAKRAVAGRIKFLSEIPTEELATFMDIYDAVRRNKKLNIVGISEIVKCFIDSFKQVADPIVALAPLRVLDEYTFTHSTNVCVLNLAQAMTLGIDGPLLHHIGVAALLHDIGKLYVPEEILNKPGKLTDEEFELIKQHPLKGAQKLLNTPGVPRLAVVTAYEHHLKYNLSGYPRVRTDWKQNLCSQMTTISDFFDALRTKRVYRDAMELEKLSSFMSELAGGDLHPSLTGNFLNIIACLTGSPAPGGSELPEQGGQAEHLRKAPLIDGIPPASIAARPSPAKES